MHVRVDAGIQAWRAAQARTRHTRQRVALAVLAQHVPMFQARLLLWRLRRERSLRVSSAIVIQANVRMWLGRLRYLAARRGIMRLQVMPASLTLPRPQAGSCSSSASCHGSARTDGMRLEWFDHIPASRRAPA